MNKEQAEGASQKAAGAVKEAAGKDCRAQHAAGRRGYRQGDRNGQANGRRRQGGCPQGHQITPRRPDLGSRPSADQDADSAVGKLPRVPGWASQAGEPDAATSSDPARDGQR
jgi:hypothetical protein